MLLGRRAALGCVAAATLAVLCVCVTAKLEPATIVEDFAGAYKGGASRPFMMTSFLESRARAGCDPNNCEIQDDLSDPDVEDAVTDEDRREWMKHTDRRAKHILQMLDRVHQEDDSAAAKSTAHDIKESLHLLSLYDKLKEKMKGVLDDAGVSVRLPSENPTYVDARGKHWEDAEMKDDVSNLFQEMRHEQEEDAIKEKRENEHLDVPQWHGNVPDGLDGGAVGHTEGAVKAMVVDKLPDDPSAPFPNSCQCNTNVVSCPCAQQQQQQQQRQNVALAPQVQPTEVSELDATKSADCQPPLCRSG